MARRVKLGKVVCAESEFQEVVSSPYKAWPKISESLSKILVRFPKTALCLPMLKHMTSFRISCHLETCEF